MSIVKMNSQYEEVPELVYSSYQANIFKAIQETTDNIIIEAVAGSGKTTTIERACSLFPPRGDHCFLAFNKKIADELSSRLPPTVPASTIHSLCLRILRSNYKKVKVSSNRAGNLLYEKLHCKSNKANRDFYFDYGRDVKRVVSRMKAMALELPDTDDVENVMENLNLDMEISEYTIGLTLQLFYATIKFDGEEDFEIDFDDMIYHVVMRADELTFPKYDTVVVDEAQDLNHSQRYLLCHLLKPMGRLVAVGDTAQAIYGFRGADHNSMRAIKSEFACTEYPLSISYRCSEAVVTAAQHFVPGILAREGAPHGRVTGVHDSDYPFMVEPGDFVLCRTWAPLILQAMKLARRGHNVCVLGNDMAPSLKKWAKDISNQYDSINSATISSHYELQVVGLPVKQEWKKYAMKEKAEMLAYICEGCSLTLKEVTDVIGEIFTDKPPATPHILLSTIHRVKGSEAERVFIIRPDLMPHPLAQGHHELQQEENLHYVALTRAKKEVWYVREED